MDWQFKVGLGVAVVFGLLPYAVKDMPPYITWPGIAAGLLFAVWGLIPNHDKFPMGPTLTFIACSVGLVGSVLWAIEFTKTTPQDQKGSQGSGQRLPTLEQLILDDFPNVTKGILDFTLDLPSGNKIKVKSVLYMDVAGGSEFVGFYIPSSVGYGKFLTYETCEFLIKEQKKIMHALRSRYGVESKRLGEANNLTSDKLVFSGRVYLYHEDDLTAQQLSNLTKSYRGSGLSVQLRGRDYLASQWIDRAQINKP